MFSAFTAAVFCCFFNTPCLLIRSDTYESIEHIPYSCNSTRKRNIVTLKSFRIARPIPFFMVSESNNGGSIKQLGFMPADNLIADTGMMLHYLPFMLIQFSG